MKRCVRIVLATLLVAFTASCGDPGEPRSLVPVVSAERPMPAGVDLSPEAPEGGAGEDCGDPTASLPPSGLATPAGSTMAEIKERGRLIAGVSQNTYLFGFRDPSTGELEGFDIDIAREVARALFGHPNQVQFKTVNVQERLTALEDGLVDIMVYAMTITCERREQVEFSSVYFEAGQRVLVRKGSGYTSLSDLGGKKVCAPKGSTSLANLVAADPKPEPVAVSDLADCLLLLQQRHVSAISTDDTVLAGMASQDPTIEVVGETFSSEPYGIGIPKDNKDMVRYVNAVLEDVRADSWREIYGRWLQPVLGPASPPSPTYQ
ncbi:glutamate ABC transporter substrate-binding protein [Haloechinothrix salitolerans]|uniref:Glutamate ABC transporter substrate-binding protein n=1 Tax=Haloechinothrix salitolerans TaxID=926830 RepID=A0ABW2BUB3_9PSEU